MTSALANVPALGAHLTAAAKRRGNGEQVAATVAGDVVSWADLGWDEPISLDTAADVPSFPVDSLPSPVREFVAELATATQTPADLAAVMTLGVLAACCAGKVRALARPGWLEPTNLFFGVGMVPASRKSGVTTAATAPLMDVERRLVARSRSGIIEATTRKEVAQAAAAQARAAAGKETGPKRAGLLDRAIQLAQEADEIDVENEPQLIVDDITPEALASKLAEHGRIAGISAEGSGFFANMLGRYSSDGAGRFENVLKAHAGDPIRVNRRGRSPEFVENPALTLALAYQPDVLRMIGERREARGLGLAARFLFAQPPSNIGHRAIAAPPVTDDVREAYHGHVLALAETTADLPKAITLQLSPGAGQHLRAFEEALEPRLKPSGDLGPIADWAGKLAGAVVRIAGVLHVTRHLRDGWGQDIAADTLDDAIAIGRYFTAHALNAFDLMGADPELERARWLLAWLKDQGVPTITQREVMAKTSRARFPDAPSVAACLASLASFGWLRAREAEPTKGRPVAGPVYEIHPRLLSHTSHTSHTNGSRPA